MNTSRVLTATLKDPVKPTERTGTRAWSSGQDSPEPLNISVVPVSSVSQLATTALFAPGVA